LFAAAKTDAACSPIFDAPISPYRIEELPVRSRNYHSWFRNWSGFTRLSRNTSFWLHPFPNPRKQPLRTLKFWCTK